MFRGSLFSFVSCCLIYIILSSHFRSRVARESPLYSHLGISFFLRNLGTIPRFQQANIMVFFYILYVSILYEHITSFFDNARLRYHLFHHNKLLQDRNTNER